MKKKTIPIKAKMLNKDMGRSEKKKYLGERKKSANL